MRHSKIFISSLNDRPFIYSRARGSVEEGHLPDIGSSLELSVTSKILVPTPTPGSMAEDPPSGSKSPASNELAGMKPGSPNESSTPSRRSPFQPNSGLAGQDASSPYEEGNSFRELHRRAELFEEYGYKLPPVVDNVTDRVIQISKDSRTKHMLKKMKNTSSGVRYGLGPYPDDFEETSSAQILEVMMGDVYIFAWTDDSVYWSHHWGIPGFEYEERDRSGATNNFWTEVLPFTKNELNPEGAGPGLLEKDDKGEFKMKGATIKVICPSMMPRNKASPRAKYQNASVLSKFVQDSLRGKSEVVLYNATSFPNRAMMALEWSEKIRHLRLSIASDGVTGAYEGHRVVNDLLKPVTLAH